MKGGFTVSCTVDWNLIRAEYIAGGTSYRKLALKHGINRTTLELKGKEEGWYKQKLAVKGKTMAKTVEMISEIEANKAVKIETVADTLLDKLMFLAESAPTTVYSIKEMSAALKILKDIKGVKSEIDLKEQKARIKNLEKQAKEESKVQQIEVVMQGFEEYSE